MSSEPETPAEPGDPAATAATQTSPGRPARFRRGGHPVRRLVGRAVHARLRLRVMLGVVAVVLAALAGFDYAAVTVLHDELLSTTDQSLRSVLTVTEPRLGQLIPSVVLPASRPAPAADAPDEVLYEPGVAHSILGQYSVAYVSTQGKRILLEAGFGTQQSPITWSELSALLYVGTGSASTGSTQTGTVTPPGGHAQLRVSTLRSPAGVLVASTALGPVDTTVGQLERIVVLGSIALVLLIAAGVFLVLRRGLRPIEAMADQADRVTAGDLAERVPARHPDSEVGRLAAALNGMLGRIETSVHEREADQEAVRRFFDDASHELRTPLASLRANAELYLQGALTRRAQIDEVIRRVALETRRMGSLVDDMLRLARLDQRPERRREPVDLTALVVERVDRARARDRDRRWKANVAPDLVVIGDEELLGRALDNLLSNISTHTPAGTWAEVTAEPAAPVASDEGDRNPWDRSDQPSRSIRITVADNGHGVPAEALPRLFDRFFRAPTTERQPGSGLGLAIVAEAAATHDGRVEAMENSPQGLRIVMDLPTSPT